ncbi:MAG: hypothetical protein ACRDPO_10720 [Streptosporangiaceae bacterium]
MPQSRGSELARVAVLLPELAAVVLRRDNSPKRIAATGVRLGGLLAWGVEQARFSAELISPEITEACRAEPFRPVPAPPGADFALGAGIPQNSAAIARFKVAGESGEQLEVLICHPAAGKAISADGGIALKLIRTLHNHPRRMSAEDLAELFRLVALMAAQEADLSAEADGLRHAAGLSWLAAPRVVRRTGQFLIQTSLDGGTVEDLPGHRRESAYRDAVIAWARTLAEDGILHTFMRRDQIRFQETGVGVTRWAGTCRAEPVLQAFVPSLAQAAFGPAVDRARGRSELLGLLAYGLGVAGSLEDLADLCVALVSHCGPLRVSRPLMPGLLIRGERADAPERMSLTRLLRQLVWFRDLGLACGAADLAVPWRELAHEVRSER